MCAVRMSADLERHECGIRSVSPHAIDECMREDVIQVQYCGRLLLRSGSAGALSRLPSAWFYGSHAISDALACPRAGQRD